MITKINICNFKAFIDSRDISLGAMNILTGINGCGKSSFLQSLLLLSQSIRKSDKHTPINLFTNADWVNLGEFRDLMNVYGDKKSITFKFSTNDNVDNTYELSYWPVQNEPFAAELKSMIVNGVETFSEAGGYDSDSDSKELIAPVFSGYTPLLRLQNLYYIAAERNAAAEEEETTNVANSTNYLDCHGNNVLNVIHQQGADFQVRIEAQLGKIFDGATFKLKADEKSIRLFMDSITSGHQFRPVNVGYGYSYILTLLTAGLLAKKDDTIIIENPEAHLHPRAQSALMHFFCADVVSRGVQVFIETHSDHIVNASLLAVKCGTLTNDEMKILFFSRSNNEPDIFINNLEVTTKGRVKNPPKNFCDQYAMDLRALMGF